MEDLMQDLPMSMMFAAFTGISWYIGIEINISLFLLFKHRRGLYFWSCALTSWGVILQPLFMILADYNIWKDKIPAIVIIYLTWLIMVVPQSWVLYSRLHLLINTTKTLSRIKLVLIFTSIVFSIPTIVIGTLAQATTLKLTSFNLIWDRVQLVVFVVQESALGILYIFQTRNYLRERAPILERSWATPSTIEWKRSKQKNMLSQLICTNLLIIALDITLIGIQCANLFYLQAAFKPCVYGIKLKVEFVILNRLIKLVNQASSTVPTDSIDYGHATNSDK